MSAIAKCRYFTTYFSSQCYILSCITCDVIVSLFVSHCNCISFHYSETDLFQCCVAHCILLYCIVMYCYVLLCIVMYCIVVCCVVLHCIALHCTVQYCIVFTEYETVINSLLAREDGGDGCNDEWDDDSWSCDCPRYESSHDVHPSSTAASDSERYEVGGREDLLQVTFDLIRFASGVPIFVAALRCDRFCPHQQLRKAVDLLAGVGHVGRRSLVDGRLQHLDGYSKEEFGKGRST